MKTYSVVLEMEVNAEDLFEAAKKAREKIKESVGREYLHVTEGKTADSVQLFLRERAHLVDCTQGKIRVICVP